MELFHGASVAILARARLHRDIRPTAADYRGLWTVRITWAPRCVSIAAVLAATTLVFAPDDAAAARRKTAAPAKQAAKVSAEPAVHFPRLIRRDILALYDGTREAAPAETRIHRQLEMPLNHLGYRVTYHDITKGLPDWQTVSSHAAIVTWFGERLPDYRSYLEWAAPIAEKGMRFVILDFVGSPLSSDDLPQANRLLKNIGLKARSIWIPETARPDLLVRDEAVVSKERPLGPSLPGFMVFEADKAMATSHVTVAGPDPSDGMRMTRSDVVVTGPGGGFIQYGFGQHYDLKIERLQWVTDPIAFLERALGKDKQRWPAPDVTTVAGRRIFFSHIDGDGWNNVSEFTNDRGARYTSAEIVRDRLIRKYPDLPVSIGLISCDIAAPLGGNPKAALVARDLFEMKNVEVASHTHSHPYRWNYFRDYSRASEISLHSSRTRVQIQDESRPGETLPQHRASYGEDGPDMPRANYVEAFDLRREISGALDSATSLAPSNKRAQLYLWSGDTSPFEEAISATRAAGVRNMNGGDSRFDTDYPSMSYVPPIGKPVGKERQIYAVNSNENTYTDGWSRDFGAQARVVETWSNTDKPRRLKGMNAYYHMYAGQKPESLEAVNQILQIARSEPVIPIPASQYAAIADSFYDVDIAQDGPSTWSIYERRNLDTLRFDGRAHEVVDFAKSSGVLGYRAHNDDLYVALDPASAKPQVTISPMPPAANVMSVHSAPATPYLVDSRWQLSQLERRDCGFKVRASGFGRGDMTWAGLHPGRYTVVVTPLENSARTANFEGEAGQNGTMRLDLPLDAIAGVDLDVTCEFTPPPRETVVDGAWTSMPVGATTLAPPSPGSNRAAKTGATQQKRRPKSTRASIALPSPPSASN